MQRSIANIPKRANVWEAMLAVLNRRAVVTLFLTGLIAGVMLLTGCSAPTVWTAEARSPDGRYVAIARTMQNGGFRSAGIVTSVSLKPVIYSNAPKEVLEFSCKGPVRKAYDLDNTANAGGTIGLRMKWSTPTHLDVSYDGRDATIEFQAVRYQCVDISLMDLSVSASK